MAIKLVCVDADDTLWHNMRHFQAALDALSAILAPFAEAQISLDTLNACEARNLKLYGYGAKGFTLSMIETATQVIDGPIPKATIADILAAGRTLLEHPVELFDDVDDTLRTLSDRARLVLVTKGDLLHQEAKLAASGLGDYFSGVEIVSDKTPETFRALFRREGVDPVQAIMAGDSLRSDIHPALEAGAHAAFIPQAGAWFHEAAALPEGHDRFHPLERLGDLPALIERL